MPLGKSYAICTVHTLIMHFSLALQILQPKQFSTSATRWGVSNESRAQERYIQYQRSNGKDGVVVAPCGFFISKSHPFLGASPDGAVYDPSSLNQPFGFLEIKCPYKHKNVTPQDVCRDPTFCCTLSDTTHQIVLKKNSPILSTSAGPDGNWEQTMV